MKVTIQRRQKRLPKSNRSPGDLIDRRATVANKDHIAKIFLTTFFAWNGCAFQNHSVVKRFDAGNAFGDAKHENNKGMNDEPRQSRRKQRRRF